MRTPARWPGSWGGSQCEYYAASFLRRMAPMCPLGRSQAGETADVGVNKNAMLLPGPSRMPRPMMQSELLPRKEVPRDSQSGRTN